MSFAVKTLSAKLAYQAEQKRNPEGLSVPPFGEWARAQKG